MCNSKTVIFHIRVESICGSVVLTDGLDPDLYHKSSLVFVIIFTISACMTRKIIIRLGLYFPHKMGSIRGLVLLKVDPDMD